MVPVVGFELTTYRLQGGCSTPELNRHILKAGGENTHICKKPQVFCVAYYSGWYSPSSSHGR